MVKEDFGRRVKTLAVLDQDLGQQVLTALQSVRLVQVRSLDVFEKRPVHLGEDAPIKGPPRPDRPLIGKADLDDILEDTQLGQICENRGTVICQSPARVFFLSGEQQTEPDGKAYVYVNALGRGSISASWVALLSEEGVSFVSPKQTAPGDELTDLFKYRHFDPCVG